MQNNEDEQTPEGKLSNIKEDEKPSGKAQTPDKQNSNNKSNDNTNKTNNHYQNDIIAEYFISLKKIGKGAFGEIFLSYNNREDIEVAIKKEKKGDQKVPQLLTEAKVYKSLLTIEDDNISGNMELKQEEVQGVPKFYGMGEVGDSYYLIMEFLGPNLLDLLKYCGTKKFTISTVALIALQVLNRIETLHKHYYIHRDIKPENFLIGIQEKSNIIYLIDFGLSKKYKNSKNHQHIPYREGRPLTGTARYVSINTHLGIEQSRRDDLESIGYTLIYFLKGSLPWQNMKGTNDKFQKILEKKLQIPTEILCYGLPDEIVYYMNYCKNLRFEDRPDYDYLRGLFIKLLVSCNTKYGLTKDMLKFDWCFDNPQKTIWTFFNKNKKPDDKEKDKINSQNIQSFNENLVEKDDSSTKKDNNINNLNNNNHLDKIEERKETVKTNENVPKKDSESEFESEEEQKQKEETEKEVLRAKAKPKEEENKEPSNKNEEKKENDKENENENEKENEKEEEKEEEKEKEKENEKEQEKEKDNQSSSSSITVKQEFQADINITEDNEIADMFKGIEGEEVIDKYIGRLLKNSMEENKNQPMEKIKEESNREIKFKSYSKKSKEQADLPSAERIKSAIVPEKEKNHEETKDETREVNIKKKKSRKVKQDKEESAIKSKKSMRAKQQDDNVESKSHKEESAIKTKKSMKQKKEESKVKEDSNCKDERKESNNFEEHNRSKRDKELNMEVKVSKANMIKLSKEPITQYYVILKDLGHGSYGQVKKVKHIQLGEERAMKIVNKKSESSHNEVEILKKISHPNIANVFEIFEDTRKYYIMMEFLDGGELFEVIISQGFFSELDAAQIMKQLLSAVNYLHSLNIVHRDLKPENIMLSQKTEDGKYPIKLIDFGTAKIFDPRKPLTKFIGTSYYIAPEVLEEKYDYKCDVWSCGIIMYILLCGYPPFNGNSNSDIFFSIKNNDPEFIDDEWTEITPDAIDLIKKMLTKNPSHRPTAEVCLKHKWFSNLNENKEKLKKERKANNEALVNKISKFVNENRFKQAVLQFISNQFNLKSEENELKELFNDLDKEKKGLITKKVFCDYLKDIYGEQESAQITNRVFDSIDLDGSGNISYDEFVSVMINGKRVITEDRLLKAFKMFDKDKSGKLSISEIKLVFGGEDEMWRRVIKEIDLNKDGEVDFNEFKTMMTKVDQNVLNNHELELRK